MSPPPQWAVDLMHRVYEDEGRVVLPELVWRRSKTKQYSSGHTSADGMRVTVTAGGRRWQQKHILLHELAHALSPRGEHHGPAFWRKAWQLYRRYGLPIKKVRAIERGYRQGSEAGYWAAQFES